MKLLTLSLWPLSKLGFIQGLAFKHWGKSDVDAVAVQGNIFFQRYLFNHIQGLVIAAIKRTINGAFLLLPSWGFKYCRESCQQVIQQGADICTKSTALARWQLQSMGLTHLSKVIYIQPI